VDVSELAFFGQTTSQNVLRARRTIQSLLIGSTVLVVAVKNTLVWVHRRSTHTVFCKKKIAW
jgi:hypothetical protein